MVSLVWGRPCADDCFFLQIVGMEDFPVRKTIAISKQFVLHLDALRQRIPQLRHTIFVVAPECNMGTLRS